MCLVPTARRAQGELRVLLQGKPPRREARSAGCYMARGILLLGSTKLSGNLQKEAAGSQKSGLVKPLEPVQASSPVPEKNLGLWCIANLEDKKRPNTFKTSQRRGWMFRDMGGAVQ